MVSAEYVAVDGETTEINPQQLYQRLLVAGIGTYDTKSLLQYELCSYPSSLFDSKLLMRLSDKADLYVIDGGAMFQKLPWSKSTSYMLVCAISTLSLYNVITTML